MKRNQGPKTEPWDIPVAPGQEEDKEQVKKTGKEGRVTQSKSESVNFLAAESRPSVSLKQEVAIPWDTGRGQVKLRIQTCVSMLLWESLCYK